MGENHMFGQFILACQVGDTKTVKSLLTKVDPSDNNNKAIRLASENGHVEVVCLLLTDQRVDPSDHHNYAIRVACKKNYIDVVRLLLTDPRVDPTAFRNIVIRRASERGCVEIAKLLMADWRVNPNGEKEIRIEVGDDDENYELIVMFENPDAVCIVENGYAEFIQDEELRMRFLQWQYRIGGEKWAKAVDCLKNSATVEKKSI
jgi:Ankyrin repeats (3 copies)